MAKLASLTPQPQLPVTGDKEVINTYVQIWTYKRSPRNFIGCSWFVVQRKLHLTKGCKFQLETLVAQLASQAVQPQLPLTYNKEVIRANVWDLDVQEKSKPFYRVIMVHGRNFIRTHCQANLSHVIVSIVCCCLLPWLYNSSTNQ